MSMAAAELYFLNTYQPVRVRVKLKFSWTDLSLSFTLCALNRLAIRVTHNRLEHH